MSRRTMGLYRRKPQTQLQHTVSLLSTEVSAYLPESAMGLAGRACASMWHVSGRKAMCSQARIVLQLTAFPHQTISSRPCIQAHIIARPLLRNINTCTAAATAEAAPLLEWMHQRGCTMHGIELVYEDDAGRLSRELRATQDLSPGDVLLTVPLNCTIQYIDDGKHTGGDAHSSNCDKPGSSSSNSRSSGTSIDSSRRAALRRLQSRVPAASDSGKGAWQFKMALEVLYHYHQGPASPLHTYIQTLPGVQPGIPGPQPAMLYPERELSELQYGPLISDAGGQIHWWKTYSQEVLSKLPGTADDPFGGQMVSQEQLGWALSVAMSRAFGFKRLGGWALVPLVDMANHSLTSNAEILCDESGMVRMVANKQVTSGSPIYLKYGNHDSHNLLLSYGFVLPDNPADRFKMPMDLDLVLSAIYQFVGGDLPPTGRAADSLKTWQQTTLQRIGLLTGSSQPATAESAHSHHAPAAAGSADNNGSSSSNDNSSPTEASRQNIVVSIGGSPPVSEALLAAVRVALATDRKLVRGKTLQQLGDWNHPLETAHEAIVLKALVGLCTVLYKSFPTSIQQDKALLVQLEQQGKQQHMEASQQLSCARLQTAVQFRLGMKRLLEESSKTLLLQLRKVLQ